MTPSAIEKEPSGVQANPLVTQCSISPGKDALMISFFDATFVFHAQWLHDARCENGPSRDAANAYCRKLKRSYIQGATVFGLGIGTTLSIKWDDEETSRFPAVWLRLLAPIVAKPSELTVLNEPAIPKGWLVDTLVIPQVSYQKIAGEHLSNDEFLATKSWIFDTLLLDSAPGIIKITDLPEVDVFSESTQKNNLVTRILKRLFGSVFQHPMRGPDETFKVASQFRESAHRAVELPNYDTAEILLPHADHSHYENPVRVQGFHILEGTSENTFVHSFTALSTLRDEDPDLYDALCEAPMIFGRVAQFYSPPFFQTTVDAAVRKMPGFPAQVKCVRWHPHLAGYLLSPFEMYERARKAQCKFQEIMCRETHMVRIKFQPGDLYVWDNFRILHGREKVIDVPRTAMGQTVIEQVVSDQYREVKLGWLRKFIDEHWLVQTPTAQLDSLVGLVKAGMVESVSPKGDVNQ